MAERGSRRWRLVRATSVAIPHSVRRFNARARARRLASARPFLVAAALAVLVGAAAYVGYGTPVLGVEHIRVSGSGFVGDDAVRRAAAVANGTPLLGIDSGTVERRVETLVGVARARVSTDLPHTLVIDVTLRQAVAAVPQAGAYLLLDRGGVVFRKVASPPEVTVIELRTPGPGDAATQGALAVLASLPPALRDRLADISAPTSAEIRLNLADGRAIIWGDASENGTKARVALSLLHQPGKVIDVSAPNVVTVR